MVGAQFEELPKSQLSVLGLENGVKVKTINKGLFRESGIPKGFIITKIDKKKIYEIEDVYSILKKSKEGVLIEGLDPDGSKGYYGFGMN